MAQDTGRVGSIDGMDSSRCMTSRIMVLFGQP
jgi:hypothetical protein